MTQASATINVIWVRGILEKMNIENIVLKSNDSQKDDEIDELGKNPIIIFADNQKVIKLPNNLVF